MICAEQEEIMQKSDGMNYAPQGKPAPVVKEGEFSIAAIALDHGHIYGMCNGLTEAGANLKWVYDSDPVKVKQFVDAFPGVKVASSEEEVLSDPEVKLVAGAAVTSKRCDLGMRVMDAGKDYFTDKAPLTTLEQLERAKQKVKTSGKKYMVYYSERLHVESAIYAGYMIDDGAIGKVVQVIGLGPHRLGAPGRPGWFFEKDKYGGILCDIGSHQIEQYLFYGGVKDGKVVRSQIGNYNHPDYPELDDFGDCNIVGDNGTTNYFRVDWFTPDGLGTSGETEERLSWEPKVISSFESILILVHPRIVIMYSWRTAKVSIIMRYPARWDILTLDSLSWIA